MFHERVRRVANPSTGRTNDTFSAATDSASSQGRLRRDAPSLPAADCGCKPVIAGCRAWNTCDGEQHNTGFDPEKAGEIFLSPAFCHPLRDGGTPE